MTDTSHPVADTALTIAYPVSGAFGGCAVIHATGCAHTARESVGETFKRNGVYTESMVQHVDWRPRADDGYEDFYGVAPCARAKKVRAAV